MVKLWMRWCRLCAREDPRSSHINVFLKDEEDLPLLDTITQCFSVDINNFNHLPNMICIDCYRLMKTIIELKQRIAKVTAMFQELQVTSDEELDVYTIKTRHNLECDFILFAMNPFENTFDLEVSSKLSEKDEQMIDQDLIHSKTIELNPINIKMQADERVSHDRSASRSEESCSESAVKTQERDTQNIKKKYKSRKERRTEKNTKPHYCSDCRKGFLKVHNYRRHMQSAHDIKIEIKPPLFICENCGKEYKSISALKEHEHSHTEERTLKCKYCEKTFKGIPSLRQHEDTHNETNYICVVCGLQLNTQRTLRMHMAVHSDQKKHKCDHCGNEFKRAKALKNHLILHTGLKPYSCDFCDRTFASGANCRSHKKKSHPIALAAQEAAGKNNISKAKIPKLRELKAVTAKKAKMDQPKILGEDFSEDAILEENTGHAASITMKSDDIRPNDMQKSVDTASDFFQGIFGKKFSQLKT